MRLADSYVGLPAGQIVEQSVHYSKLSGAIRSPLAQPRSHCGMSILEL